MDITPEGFIQCKRLKGSYKNLNQFKCFHLSIYWLWIPKYACVNLSKEVARVLDFRKAKYAEVDEPYSRGIEDPSMPSIEQETTLVQGHEFKVMETVSTRPDGRIVVIVYNKILMPTDKCATIISDSFVERVDPDGYRWANVSEVNKEFYWDEFKKHCFWEPQDDAKVLKAWKTKASQAYSQYVFNMRNPKRNRNNKKPSLVTEQVWASWRENWNSEDFKKMSHQNKANRRNGVPDAPARPTHTSGSASHVKIASKLKRSLGAEPLNSELFLFTHTVNHDGETFINAKDQEIYAAYLDKRKQVEASGEEVDDDTIFYEVVGGHDRKRRFYGFGSYGKLIPSKQGCNYDTYPERNAKEELAAKNAQLAQMEEMVTTQKHQNDQLQDLADQLKKQNEESNAKINDLEQQIQSIFATFKRKPTE